jgi:hypothetical protein
MDTKRVTAISIATMAIWLAACSTGTIDQSGSSAHESWLADSGIPPSMGQISFPTETELAPDQLINRTAMELAYPFLGSGFSADSGGANHVVAGTEAYSLAVPGGGIAWARYSFAVTAGEAPVRVRIHITDEWDVGNPVDPSLQYWVGVSSYHTETWEWHGGYSTFESDIYLPAGQGDNYLSPAGNFHFVVVAYSPPGALGVPTAVVDGKLVTDGSGGNTPPVPFLTATPTKAAPGQQITLDASGSIDPDGTIVDYQWDLDGDGLYGENGQEASFAGMPTVNYTLLVPNEWYIGVRVIDDDGAAESFAELVTCTGWRKLDLVHGTDISPVVGLIGVHGHPAMLYKDGTAVKYAISASQYGATAEDWTHVQIADNAITIDPPRPQCGFALINGKPAVCWGSEAPESNLEYAYSNSELGSFAEDWQVVTADDYAGNVAYDCSLAEVNGYPAIAYSDGTNKILRYAYSTDSQGASGWNVLLLGATGEAGLVPQLAVGLDLPYVLQSKILNNDSVISMFRSATAQGTQQSDWSELFEFTYPGLNAYAGNLINVGGTLAFAFLVSDSVSNGQTYEYRYLDPDSEIWKGSSVVDVIAEPIFARTAITTAGPGVFWYSANNYLMLSTNQELDGSGPWEYEAIAAIEIPIFSGLSYQPASINDKFCVAYYVVDPFDNFIHYAIRFD